MANERNTENLVRNDLRIKGYYDNPEIIVEEQKSTSPKLEKLLKFASKSGSGSGRPEFIIRFKNKPSEIIVIECKASTLKHESRHRNMPSDYAVDGVLLYAEHLKKEFDVTAIAVSGETEKEKRISSFIWMKDSYKYKNIQDKVFLTASEIQSITAENLKPVTEEYLVRKAIEYNENLHKYSIPEAERCTFISSILVALQDEVFISSYNFHTDNTELLKALYNACGRVLKVNGLSVDKREIVLSEYKKFQFNKLMTSPKIKIRGGGECENNILKELIDEFNEELLPTIKGNHFDVLGKFYTQFIRYAGGDAKTGLVLTPAHITDFFCDIVDLKVDDIVFDPCCGTGGFLVSAMKYMLTKAGHSQDIQRRIKSEQLIGIEQRNDMFSHVCSNMMMRGDGKSHIYHGDCFDAEILNSVKKEKPTISFLNPPYQDGNAAEQLEFIENALDLLVKGGTCVAICQMSTVVSSQKKVTEVKRRLLEKHTLKAVFSMPDDLFYPVGVITSILIFESKVAHSEMRETFFGYFKNDGFVKTKNKGRVDVNDRWHLIKNRWLDSYFNMRNIAGLSVTHKVRAEDEWCAEAYMETDYSTISKADFSETIKMYALSRLALEKI
ncbi:HsdM family class I SAM-dependent methyltransferase [Serratia quinivorans]